MNFHPFRLSAQTLFQYFTDKSLVIGVLCLVLFAGCQTEENSNPPSQGSKPPTVKSDKAQTHEKEKASTVDCQKLKKDQTLAFGKILVDIKVPAGQIRGDLLVLPGWSFSRKDWCQKSSLCHKALRDGYRVVMPEMGKSIYSSAYYPESRTDWLKYPTRTWLTDTLLVELQNTYCLFQPGSKNFVVGLSTGGRGVALVCLHTGSLFTAGAALSGDYDQALMTGDNLMRGIYGDYTEFPERWDGMDNPARNAAKFKTPLYLGHGKSDDVVAWEQTEHFYKVLKAENPDLTVKLNLAENMGHDYAYWNSEVGNMLTFFSDFHKTMAESSHAGSGI